MSFARRSSVIFCCSEAACWSSSIGRLPYLSCHFFNQDVIFSQLSSSNFTLVSFQQLLSRNLTPRPKLYIKWQNTTQHNEGHQQFTLSAAKISVLLFPDAQMRKTKPNFDSYSRFQSASSCARPEQNQEWGLQFWCDNLTCFAKLGIHPSPA